MSYPTPWRLEPGGDILSADNQVVATNIDGYGYYFENEADDLVNRVNAGIEAEAWKKEATIVIEKISLHEVGKALNVPLGGCISSAILPGIQELEARAERAEKALEESEEAMHQRIRATYDKAVANSWRTVVKELVDALDVALAKTDKFKRNHHGDILGDFPECMHDWARDCGAVLRKYAYLKEKEEK